MIVDAAHFKISITHIGEWRSVFSLIAAFSVDNCTFCLPEVSSIEFTAIIQDFCASDRELLSLLHKGSVYQRNSSMVLTEVQNHPSFLFIYFNWLQGFMVFYLTDSRLKGNGRRQSDLYCIGLGFQFP